MSFALKLVLIQLTSIAHQFLVSPKVCQSHILDIDLSNLKTHSFSGVKTGEEGIAYPYMVDIGVEETFFRIPVLFSFDLSFEWGMGILGQVGFFDHYIIEFDRKNKRLQLKEG